MKLYTGMTLAISLPQEPTPIESFSGEEIRKYLTKIFGQVTFAEIAPLTVIIGDPTRNEQAKSVITEEEYAEKVSGTEGFLYQIKENTLLLAGNTTGQLYAVYEFLEQEFGCCFGAITLPDTLSGETVPACAEKDLPDTVRFKADADLHYRMASVQYGTAGSPDRKATIPFIDYLAKNRFNRIQTWVSVYQEMVKLGLMEEIAKRGIRITVSNHQVLGFFLPFEGNEEFPTAYAKEHPDFFKVMVDGRRQTSLPRAYWGQWYLCSRNRACIEEMAKNMNDWLDRNPNVDTIAVCPNDGVSRQCQCGYCSKHTKMENYLYFSNEVAKLLKERHAERKVDLVVYLDMWGCPKGTQLSENAEVKVATWTRKGLRHVGKPDGSCLTDSHIMPMMHQFRDSGSEVVVYEYYMGNYDNLQAVMPAADEMQSISKYYKKHGFSGSGTQVEGFNVWNNILNFYTFARTHYDNGRTLECNITEMSRLFGAGAEPIGEILRIYENTLDGQVPINQTGRWFALHVDKETIYDLFEKAFTQAETPLYRNNVRLMRMAFRYTILLQTDTDEDRAELGAMATHFDGFHVNDPGFGISFDVEYRTETLPTDKWYQFEQ